MDKVDFVKQIIESYDGIEFTRENDGIVFFQYRDKEYGCWYPDADKDSSSPILVVKNDENYDYPHILPFNVPLEINKSDQYRCICLYETESTVKYLQSKEEKVKDVIDRLLILLSLSPLEREHEFQKEFVYYWDNMAENNTPVQIYAGSTREFQRLNLYFDGKSTLRYVANGIKLSDAKADDKGKKKWNHKPEVPGFYIPIEDNRRILPPTRDRKWKADDILRIVCGKDLRRISHETYQKLNQEKIKTQKVSLIFEMKVNGNCVIFTATITFRSAKTDTLMNKLRQDIMNVQIVKSRRIDYYFLCKQIGNDTSLYCKKILLVGAGSLGSYTARELIRAGIRDITVYDADDLEKENLLRHTCDDYCVGFSKVFALKFELERLHPEIHIEAVNRDVQAAEFVEILPQFDMAIITVGSSDIQIEMNRALKQGHCNKPVIFTWLEAGGKNSHILTVDNNYEGCFQCLFTDANGRRINNKVNRLSVEKTEQNKIRNGCGGTRAAYGNAILLRTVAALLNIMQEIFDGKIHMNKLFDIIPTQVIDMGNDFRERKCQCCSNEYSRRLYKDDAS